MAPNLMFYVSVMASLSSYMFLPVLDVDFTTFWLQKALPVQVEHPAGILLPSRRLRQWDGFDVCTAPKYLSR